MTIRTIPQSPLVPDSIAEWNRVHDPAHIDHQSYRVTQAANGYSPVLWPIERTVDTLADAARLLAEHPDNWEVQADVYAFLDNASRLIAHHGVPAWIVTKHYNDPNPKSAWHGRTAQWCGWRRKANALACAKLMPGRYPHKRETWTVERGRIAIHSVVADGVTPAEYMKSLG